MQKVDRRPVSPPGTILPMTYSAGGGAGVRQAAEIPDQMPPQTTEDLFSLHASHLYVRHVTGGAIN